MSYDFVEYEGATINSKGREKVSSHLSLLVAPIQYRDMQVADMEFADRLDDLRGTERGQEMPNLAFGFKNGTMVANQIFPVLGVDYERGFVRQHGKEEFVYYPSKRAIHAHSNRIITGSLEPIEWKLDEYDLEEPTDYREQSESGNKEEARAAKRVSNLVFGLGREVRVATMVKNTALYTNGNTGTPTIKWNAANATPVDDFAAAKEVVRGNVGMNPDSVLFSAQAWFDITRSPQILGLTGTSTTRVVTMEVIKQVLGIENIIIGDGVYKTTVNAASVDIWNDTATLFIASRGNTGAASEGLPGFGYTLQKKLWPAMDTYVEVGGKVKLVRATSIEGQFFLGSIAGYHFTNTRS